MDERLEAGRHHLINGSRALEQGYPDDAHAYYQAALLQFRGPELRLGEAHALRGLARVELAQGGHEEAERLAARAVVAYEDLEEELERLDPEGAIREIRKRALEGEAAAWIVRADARLRSGSNGEVLAALERARTLAEAVRYPPLLADVDLILGRVALREGRVEETLERWNRARSLHHEATNPQGEAGVWLLLAELHRWRGDPDAARAALDKAGPLAEAQGSDRLLGRVTYGRAVLALANGNTSEASVGFDTALPLLRRAGDFEMAGYAHLGLAEVASRTAVDGARPHLTEALRRLGTVGSRHGVASTGLQVAAHALRSGEPEIALVAAAAAWSLWRTADPVRGQGQALRAVTRALHALCGPLDALVAALVRASVAGEDQPSAVAIADWLREETPEADADALQALSSEALLARLDETVAGAIDPTLARAGLTHEVLDGVSGARQVLDLIIEQLPEVAAPAPEPEPAISASYPEDEEQPTGAFAVLGGDRPGKAGTPSPAPTRRAYHPPAPDEEESS